MRLGKSAAGSVAVVATVSMLVACTSEQPESQTEQQTKQDHVAGQVPAGLEDAAQEKRAWSDPSSQHRFIPAAGLNREYFLSLPAGAKEREKLPVIFVFHGYGDSAENIRRYSRFDRADALVVYMQGLSSAWAPAPYATTTGDADLAFVDAVREELDSEFDLDRARVFASGMSNGGGFATFVGCQRPQDFTAIGSVSAAHYARVSEGCSAIPIKQIDIHGTADEVISYGGGQRHQTVYDSVPQSLEETARRNHCVVAPKLKEISARLTRFDYVGCDAALAHYRIDGGRHVWPGEAGDASGAVPDNFATQVQLDFFGVSST